MMIDDDPANPTEEQEASDSPDPIARLIKLAGPRTIVPVERALRVRALTRADWHRALGRDRRRRAVLTVMQVAAAIVVAVGVGIWLRGATRHAEPPVASFVTRQGSVLRPDGPASGAARTLAAGARLITGSDGRAALQLAGGPIVRLDTGTEMRLISAHILELQRGAIYVDTTAHAAGESAAIEVRTDLGTVHDVGTRFEVRLGEEMLRISVREGLVGLARDDRTYTAPAGTRLQVDPRGSVETTTIGAGDAEWGWVLAVAPPFDLEGRTLRDYVDWLSSETGWKVTFADAAIAARAGGIILHGSTAALRPDETPAAVLPPCGLRHRLEGETLIIMSATDSGRSE